MAATDARPVPIKNTAYRAYFTILDADGDPVTGASALDSEVSLDGAAFADCTNEATEISQGVYYLDLTSGEMNADAVCVLVKTSTSGAKSTLLVFYPQESGDIKTDLQSIAGSTVSTSTAQLGVNVVNFGGSAGTFASGIPAVNATQISGDSTAADNLENAFDDTAGANRWTGVIDQGTAQSATGTTLRLRAAAAFADDELNGCWLVITGGSTGVGQVRQITDYASATDTATVDTWTTTPTGTITYQVIPAAMVAADVTKFGGTAATTASGRPEVNTTHAAGTAWGSGAITAGVFASGAITAGAIAADAIGASELAADAVAEIADAVWDEATSGHVASGTFGQREFPLRANTAQAGANGSITLDASASAVDDFYKNAIIVITGGTGVNQARTISGYTGSSKVATVTPNWGTNPSSDSVFVILPAGAIAGASAPTAGEVADAVWDEARSGHVTSGSFGEYTPANVSHFGGSAGTFSGGRPEVNTSHAAGTAWNSGAIGASTLAADTITAAKIAADAIGASELATSAVDEIVDAVWDEARAGHVAAGSFGEGAASVQGNVTGSVASVTGAVGSVTGNVGGNVTGSVGSVAPGGIAAASFAAGAIDASAIAADAIGSSELAASAASEIATAVRTELTTELGRVDAAISSRSSHTAADIWSSGTRTLTNGPGVKKNTAQAGFMFKMVDLTDGYTAETGVTVTATRSLDGAAFGACANSASEVASGWYTITLAAADVNGDVVVLRFTGAGCRDTEIMFVTEP